MQAVIDKFLHPLRREWHWTILLTLPLLITLINPNWLYNPYALNSIDTWIYHGLFQNFFDFAKASHIDHLYFYERLSWILPGYLLYHLFSPVIANGLLHFGVYYLTVFTLYGTARRLFGRDAALITALCLGLYTWFLRAVGHDYLDGAGIAYYSTALWFATKAVYQPRHKLYLVCSGAFLALTLVTQLFWAAFIPLVALYYLVLNAKQAHHPIILSGAWVSAGVLGVISGLIAFNFLTVGKWNIFTNSVMFIRSLGITGGNVRESVFASGYNLIPMTWMVLPSFLAICAVIVLARSTSLSEQKRIGFRAITLVFSLTFSIFLYLHFTSAFPYLIIYLYMSLTIPASFLLFAGVISACAPPVMTARQSLVTVSIALVPFVVSVVIQSFEAVLLNPMLVWPLTALALVVVLGALIRKANPILLIGAFSVMSLLFSGHNGIAYYDRLRTYKIFVGADEMSQAIALNAHNLSDVSEIVVWAETADEFRPYTKAARWIYWGRSDLDWNTVQSRPASLYKIQDAEPIIVMLSDNPDIIEKIRTTLTGLFEVRLETTFTLPGIDSTGRYRGYLLTIARLDTLHDRRPR